MHNFKRTLILFLIAGITFHSLLLYGETAADLIKQGDELSKKWNYKEAAETFEKALAVEPNSYEALWKAANNWVKQAMMVSKDQKEALYEKGIGYAKKAIQVNPNGSDGYTMLAIAEGRLALFKGGKQKVTLSKNVKANAEKALKFNPNDNRALHVLGAWNRKVATLSFILKAFAKIVYGGLPPANKKDAVEFMEKAVKIRPDRAEHYLELGKCYESVDKEDLARKAYEQCLKLAPTEKYDEQFKREAKKLLEVLQKDLLRVPSSQQQGPVPGAH